MPRLRLRHAPAALLIWLVVVVMVTSCSLRLASSGGGETETGAGIVGLPAEFERLVEVWELLQREHIDRADMDGKTLSDGAIRGMLQALDDPPTPATSPPNNSAWNLRTSRASSRVSELKWGCATGESQS